MALAAKLDEPDILDSSFCCQQPFRNKSSSLHSLPSAFPQVATMQLQKCACLP
jgi:hypothetical protein